MQLQTLHKATSLYTAIQNLDKDISELNGYAKKFVEEEFNIDLKLCVLSNEPKDPNKGKQEAFLKDLKKHLSEQGGMFGIRINGSPEHEDVDEEEDYCEIIKRSIDANIGLSIVNVLILKKKEERKLAIKQLIDLGYKL